ncbi:hypothetical protein D3C77_340960 [compost metagenome]
MRLALRIFIITEVDERMRLAHIHVFQPVFLGLWNVAVYIFIFLHGQVHGLVTQRAAAEQAANVLLLW